MLDMNWFQTVEELVKLATWWYDLLFGLNIKEDNLKMFCGKSDESQHSL